MDINYSDNKFTPTTEWIEQKYYELNRWLFNGELGYCNFKNSLSGKGKNGRALGKFSYGVPTYWYKGEFHRFVYGYDNEKVYINHDNFYELCQPTISLNGNYKATEHTWISILLHEMCHYYVNMDGDVVDKAHMDSRFKDIISYISSKSNGAFKLKGQHLGDHDSLELDASIKKKNDERLNNKKKNMKALIIITEDGDIQLTTTSNDELISKIIHFNRSQNRNGYKCKRILLSNDSKLIDKLVSDRYSVNQRTYKFYPLEKSYWDEIKKYNYEEIPMNINESYSYAKHIANDILNEILTKNGEEY